MTPPGVEPATFCLVAPCLNKLRHHVPLICCEGFNKDGRRELFTTKMLVSGYDTVLQTGKWVMIIRRNIPPPFSWREYPEDLSR